MTCCLEHYTPHTLALDLCDVFPPERIRERLERCSTCRAAKDTLDLWARRIGHDDPKVWPEYATAPHLLAELLRLPHHRRLSLVGIDELYQHWGLFRLALEDSRTVGYSSATGARHMAELALAIAHCLPEDYYGAHPVADQLALAWANRARVAVAEEPAAAGRWLRDAEVWVARGTGAGDVARHVAELLAPVRSELAGEERGEPFPVRAAAACGGAAPGPASDGDEGPLSPCRTLRLLRE